MNNADKTPLIKAEHLIKHFKLDKKRSLHAVDDISFEIFPGETLGVVGESGCGKSTVGNVVMRLIPATGGKLLYRGKDVFTASKQDSFELRKKMQIIFQDPYSSLNSRKTVYDILEEAYQIHHMGTKEQRREMVMKLCDMVELSPSLLDHYPHELDGEMRQVVGIARALSLNPDFIVCDEPVSALDVSVQARIVNLLMDIQKKNNLSYLFISHDLSVVRHISTRIAVMYLGQFVETADTDDIFRNAMHPYSIALLSAVPRVSVEEKVQRIILEGDVPSPVNPKPGCRFASRCWMRSKECSESQPPMTEVEPGHYVACFHCHEARENMKHAKTKSLADMEKVQK